MEGLREELHLTKDGLRNFGGFLVRLKRGVPSLEADACAGQVQIAAFGRMLIGASLFRKKGLELDADGLAPITGQHPYKRDLQFGRLLIQDGDLGGHLVNG